jgi:hypothetical protein
MDIRKIGAVAGFAAGAAFALAPLASADPVEITSTVSGEIASLNSLFELGAALTGVPSADITLASAGHPFDTVLLADAPNTGTATPFDYFLYGVDPINQAGSDPGSYDLFNGALGKFDDAYNVLLYGALNGGAIDPNDADFIGTASSIDHAQGLATVTDAFDYFYNFGVNDLSSYFGSDLSFLLIPTTDAASGASIPGLDGLFDATLASEISALNSTFELDVAAAGIDPDKIVTGMGAFPFDTIDSSNTNDVFNTLVFGLNPDNITDGIPGSYDVFNGAFTEFSNAFNVGLFSLLDPTGTFDPLDIFGTHADFLAGGTASAISDFLQLGFQDLLGYFDPTALLGAM